jgi:hypothetical protein
MVGTLKQFEKGCLGPALSNKCHSQLLKNLMQMYELENNHCKISYKWHYCNYPATVFTSSSLVTAARQVNKLHTYDKHFCF